MCVYLTVISIVVVRTQAFVVGGPRVRRLACPTVQAWVAGAVGHHSLTEFALVPGMKKEIGYSKGVFKKFLGLGWINTPKRRVHYCHESGESDLYILPFRIKVARIFVFNLDLLKNTKIVFPVFRRE